MFQYIFFPSLPPAPPLSLSLWNVCSVTGLPCWRRVVLVAGGNVTGVGLIWCVCAELCRAAHSEIHLSGRRQLTRRNHVEKSLHKEGKGKIKAKWRVEGGGLRGAQVYE